MDIVNHTVLAWLEEDNQRLGHFRVRPLLRETGPFTPSETEEWRDDGFVRVVPDKSEQRSCKERMRSLGNFCLLALTGANADKFKSNKNYAPSKGEKNRYIVYSNAVKPVPERVFYEVIPESMLSRAVTAQAFSRQGGKIRGPVDRASGVSSEAAHPLPPDDPRIFSVTLPDGSVRLFYWPLPEAEAVREASAAADDGEMPEISGDAGEMTAIDQIKALDREAMRLVQAAEHPEEAQKPKEVLIADDAGTPLYHTQAVAEAPAKRKRNPLAEMVESSRKPARKDEPEKKGAEKSRTKARQPAASLAEWLRGEWTSAPDRGQLITSILSLPNARAQFAQALGGTDDPALAALRAQLQDVEAERLMTVMNLNQAKAQEAQYRDTLVEGLVQSERATLDRLRAETADAQKALGQEQRQLLENQTRLAEQLGYPVIWPAQAEEDAPAVTVAHRIAENLRAAGFAGGVNDAVTLLLVLLQRGNAGFCLQADSLSDSREAAEALSAALGGQCVDASREIRLLRGGTAALLWLSRGGEERPLPDAVARVCLQDTEDDLPVIRLRQSGDMPVTFSRCPAVDMRLLREKLAGVRTPLNAQGVKLLARLRALCEAQACVLPLRALREMTAYAEMAQNLLEGGVTAAIDRAVTVFALPCLRRMRADMGFLRELSQALPLTREAAEHV